MSDRRLEPLDDDLDRLLAAERDRPGPPPEARARLAARLEATLGPFPDPGSGIRPVSPPAAPVVAPTAGASSFALPLAVGLVAGGVVAALITLRGPDPVPVVTPAVTSAPVTLASVEEPRAEPAPIVLDAGPAPPPPRASASPREESLAAERALLDEAQRALGSGRSGDALGAISRHAAQFPRGRLSEEREGLAVQALLAAGRRDEARTRAERFKRSHPGSLLLPALESSLGPIP